MAGGGQTGLGRRGALDTERCNFVWLRQRLSSGVESKWTCRSLFARLLLADIEALTRTVRWLQVGTVDNVSLSDALSMERDKQGRLA